MVYRLYFRPSHGKWDGRFHRIEVKPQRRGIEVGYRAGYRAIPAGKEEAPPRIEMLARSPLESTGIGLSMRLQQGAQAKVAQLVADPDGLSFEARNGKWRGLFEVWVLLLKDDGSVAKE